MSTNQAAVFDVIDAAAQFMVMDVPMPEPGPGEIRIRTAAFALNQSDIATARGVYNFQHQFPARFGLEAAGIVDAIGPSVTRYKVGDRATTLPNLNGPYHASARYILAREEFTAVWPEGWSAEQAASMWVQYLTAYYPFEKFGIGKNDWLLITAASGGTGVASIRLATMLGARVIATTRSDAKRQTLFDYGAEAVLSTDDAGFDEEVMRLTDGKGLTLITDSFCGPYVERFARLLAMRGNICVYGALSGSVEFTVNMLTLLQRQAGVHAFSLMNELRDDACRARGITFISDAAMRGALPPPTIDSVYPLAEIAAACDRVESAQQIGKIVVSMEG